MYPSTKRFSLKPIARFPTLAAALPHFDVGDYRFTVKLDRIVLRVTPEKGLSGTPASSFNGVQGAFERALGYKPGVKMLADDPRIAPRRAFEVTIQDPVPARLLEAEKEVRAAFGNKSTVRIQELEIALDAFPKDPTDAESVRSAVAYFRRHFAPKVVQTNLHDPLQFPRIRGPKLTTKLISGPDRPAGFPMDDFLDHTYYVGRRKDDAVFFKLYRKTMDRIGGDSKRFLTPEEQCVRLELTASGLAVGAVCGGYTLAELIAGRCRAAKEHFRFLVPVVPLDGDASVPLFRDIRRKRREITLQRWEEFGFCGGLIGRPRPAAVKAGHRSHEEMRLAFHEAFRAFQRGLERAWRT